MTRRAATKPGTNRWIGAAAKGLLLLSSAGIAVGFMELAVRTVLPQQLIQVRPDIWMPDDGLGWVVRPDLETTINTGERTVRVRTDVDGFRIGETGRVDAGADAAEVLVLGDSFMQALQVEHEQSLPGLIEARLGASLPGRRVVVRNAGVDGWDPSQYAIRLAGRLADDPPDLVVVAFYLGNDMIRARRDHVPPRTPVEVHRLRWPRSLGRGEIVDALLYPVNDALEVRSHLFALVKARLRGVLLRLGLSADYVPIGVLRSEAQDPMWDVTTEVLADMHARAAERGVSFLVVLIPPPFAVDPRVAEQIRAGFDLDEREIDARQPARLIEARLDALGVPTVSVLQPFTDAADSGVQLYGDVDRHLSPVGHETLYDLIEPSLVHALEIRR